MHVKLVVTGICIAAVGLSCPSARTRTASPSAVQAGSDVVLFFSGSELGVLKPCGCSSGQLGGLEKRTSIFESVARANRLIIGTGDLVPSDQEQDLIKFRILFEGFGLLGYDLVHLTPADVEIARQLNVLGGDDRPFGMISPREPETEIPRAFSRQFRVGARTVHVNVAAFDAEGGPIDAAASLFPDDRAAETLNILILRGFQRGTAQEVIAKSPPGIDCIICPSDSDEPWLLSAPDTRPLAFTVGRFGRHICRIDVTFPQNGPAGLRFTEIPVEETLPNDEALVRLYQSYQQLVRESDLLEKYPRIPLPDDLAYTGSKTCAPCHAYASERWSTKAHANAFATLKRVGSDRDPECVMCHVVGLEYTGGFVTEEQTPHLKDVGCEACHGPGSEHILTAGKAKTVEPKMHCTACHTPEHSGQYAGNEEEFMKKIVHWPEP